MPTSPTKRSQNKRNQQTNQRRTTSHQEVATRSSPTLEELLKRIESIEGKVAELESELIVINS